MFHFLKESPLLGLDFGRDEIRILQLGYTAEGQQIEKLLYQPFSSEILEGNKTRQWTLIQQQLAKLVVDQGLSGFSVALAMRSQHLIRKRIQLPSYLKEDELREEIQRRLLEYFPGQSEKELYYDFNISNAAEEWYQVLLVASSKIQLQPYVDLVTRAGLRAKIVDGDLYARARAGALYFYQDSKGGSCLAKEPEAVALLDFHWPLSTFLVFQPRDVIFHQQWQVEQAVFKTPLACLDQLFQQVKTLCQSYAATHPGPKLKAIGLTGEMAELEPIADYLQERLSLPVQSFNPLQPLGCSPILDAALIKKASSRFLLCCGLALRATGS